LLALCRPDDRSVAKQALLCFPGSTRAHLSPEIFSQARCARQGKLKGAQFHKVARDALKLITIKRGRPSATVAIAFGCQKAANCVRNRSWLSEALVTWEVEVIVVQLERAVRDSILTAQARQIMVNPDDD
jgi:hypothetical protein